MGIKTIVSCDNCGEETPDERMFSAGVQIRALRGGLQEMLDPATENFLVCQGCLEQQAEVGVVPAGVKKVTDVLVNKALATMRDALDRRRKALAADKKGPR